MLNVLVLVLTDFSQLANFQRARIFKKSHRPNVIKGIHTKKELNNHKPRVSQGFLWNFIFTFFLEKYHFECGIDDRWRNTSGWIRFFRMTAQFDAPGEGRPWWGPTSKFFSDFRPINSEKFENIKNRHELNFFRQNMKLNK